MFSHNTPHPHGEPPTADGFGSALVRNTVTGQLGGSLHHDWDAQGLRVTIRIPFSKVAH